MNATFQAPRMGQTPAKKTKWSVLIFQAPRMGQTGFLTDDFDFEFKDADEMNQEITLDEGTEDAVEDIAEETVAVSEDEE